VAHTFPLSGQQLFTLSLKELEVRLGIGKEEIASAMYATLQSALAMGEVAKGVVSHNGKPRVIQKGATRGTGARFSQASLEAFHTFLKTGGSAGLHACLAEADAWPEAIAGSREASMKLLKRGKTQYRRQCLLLQECHENAEETYKALVEKLGILEAATVELNASLSCETHPDALGSTYTFPTPMVKWDELPKAQMGVKRSEEAFETYHAAVLQIMESDGDCPASIVEAGGAFENAWKDAQEAYVARSEAIKQKEVSFEKCRGKLEEACKEVVDEVRDKVDRYLEHLARLQGRGVPLPPAVLDMAEEYEATKQAHEDLLRLMGRA